MKHVGIAGTVSLVIILLASCSAFATKPANSAIETGTPKPVSLKTIINHEKPDVVFTPRAFEGFENIGECDERGYSTFWGGLTPNHSIIQCFYRIPWNVWDKDAYSRRCFLKDARQMGMYCRNYVTSIDGTHQFIRNNDEFRAIFAPVDLPEEALAFVLMNNITYSALYGQTEKDSFVYYVKTVEVSHVDVDPSNGYIVHVFDTQIVGCGPFITYAVEVKVGRDGRMEETNRHPVYRDPSLDKTCVD